MNATILTPNNELIIGFAVNLNDIVLEDGDDGSKVAKADSGHETAWDMIARKSAERETRRYYRNTAIAIVGSISPVIALLASVIL